MSNTKMLSLKKKKHKNIKIFVLMSPTSGNHSATERRSSGGKHTRAGSAREGKRLFCTPRLRLKFFESFIYSRRQRGGEAAQDCLTANPLCAEFACFWFFSVLMRFLRMLGFLCAGLIYRSYSPFFFVNTEKEKRGEK